VTLLEPDVALTDFVLAIECAWFAVWLYRRSPMGQSSSRWFVLFFAALSVSALLGGISHGFLSDTQSSVYRTAWGATLLSIGVASFSSWAAGARVLFCHNSHKLARRFEVFAGLLLCAYVAAVLFFSQSFTVAVVHYLPAAAFLLASLLVAYWRRREPHLLPGIAGLLLSFMAAAIQQAGAHIPSLQLSHNALYHLVQAVALLMIFFTARGLAMEALCEPDANS
jgi:hypothetical protein